nr:hypothetical protein [Tanacetum cinerariifolium]
GASMAKDVVGYVKDATMGSVSYKAKMAKDVVERITFFYETEFESDETWNLICDRAKREPFTDYWPSSMPSDTFQQADTAAKSGIRLTCIKLFYGISMLLSPASFEIRDHIVHASWC